MKSPEHITHNRVKAIPEAHSSHPENVPSALDYFHQNLELLLSTKFGQWVVCTPYGIVQEGNDEIALYEWCKENNFKDGTYLVSQVLPDQPVADVPDEWVRE